VQGRRRARRIGATFSLALALLKVVFMRKLSFLLVALLGVRCSSDDPGSPAAVAPAADAGPASVASSGGAAGPDGGGSSDSGTSSDSGGTVGSGGNGTGGTGPIATGGTGGDLGMMDAGVGPDLALTGDLAPAGDVAAIEPVDAGQQEVGLPKPPANCNMMTNLGVKVAETQIAEPLPTPTGGLFPAGHRFLIAQAIYTGPGGATGPTGKTRQHHIYVSRPSGVIRIDQVDSLDGSANLHGQMRADPSGSMALLLFETCPTVKPIGTVGYSVDGLKLILIDPVTRVVSTYGNQ
jgi:hypothetical protein